MPAGGINLMSTTRSWIEPCRSMAVDGPNTLATVSSRSSTGPRRRLGARWICSPRLVAVESVSAPGFIPASESNEATIGVGWLSIPVPASVHWPEPERC
jgi:hypothetical protein